MRPRGSARPTAGDGAGRWPLRLTGAATLLLFAGLAGWLAPLDPGPLVLQFTATPRSFALVVHAWSEADLARYRAHLPADGLLLLAYAAFGWLLASRTRTFAPLPARLRGALRWTLPLAASFDAAENGLHWWLTAQPRFGPAWPYAVSAGCAIAKWLLVFGFAALVLIAWARRPD